MRLHVLTNDGSPLQTHYKDIDGQNGRVGLGGAELYLHLMCKYWHDQGHELVLYNDPIHPDGSPYEQRAIASFEPEANRDVLIVFRSPNTRSYSAKGKKIWLSCDQQTVGDFKAFGKTVQKIVTISPYHSEYFANRYGLHDTVSIDIPVRLEDYQNELPKERQMMFCSVPDRGVDLLARAWNEVNRNFNDVKLVITSSWGLWDGRNHESRLAPYRLKFAKYRNVEYHGAVSRKQFIQMQLQSAIHAYPCRYPELFCISNAEMQAAGAYPITSTAGALATTNMGQHIHGNVEDGEYLRVFGETLCQMIENPELPRLQQEVREKAFKRFDINVIGKKWDEVFNG